MKATSKLVGSLVCAVAFLFAASQVSAANVLTNPGFEDAGGSLNGWSLSGLSGLSTVTALAGDNGPSAPGTHYAFMDNSSGAALGLTLKQSSAAGSAGPGLVNWSFDLGFSSAAAGGVFFVEIFAEKAGGGVIGGSGLLGNFTDGAWTAHSGSFVAPALTDFLTIQFEANTAPIGGSTSRMRVDNVNLSPTVVPEPTTVSLVGLGLIGLLGLRRRKA